MSKAEIIEILEDVAKKLAALPEDQLIEFGALHQLQQLILVRKNELRDAAIKLSLQHLEDIQKESGDFESKGQLFSLSKTNNFDFVDDVKRYANEEGALYRKTFYEREALLSNSKVKTTLLGSLRDNFIINHPDWKPDSVTYTMKVKNFDFSKM